MGLLDMLAQAVSSGNSSQQFNQIAQSAPSDVLAKGLAGGVLTGANPVHARAGAAADAAAGARRDQPRQ